MQSVLVVLCWISVVGPELRIRLVGGSGVFLAQAPAELAAWAHRLLATHFVVTAASATGMFALAFVL